MPPELLTESRRSHMFAVTFYSYKGGVGRTSALVNVAYRLAHAGKRVFILDFDLEAPGIDSYGLTESTNTESGLVEYINTFMQTGDVPPIRDFVVQASMSGTGGRLFVMPAGRKDDAYKTSLSSLDWKLLYRQKKGYLLIENLKAAIQNEYKPDYLLIDSRTGLTDISGICTLQLPHLVVLLFSLNQQNVAGIAPILRTIRANRISRNIATVLVASPVPDMPQWVEARGERFEYARKLMGSAVDIVLPYDPFLAFKESIVDGEEPSQSQTYLGKAYDALTDKIVSVNPADVRTLLMRALELKEDGNYELAELQYREAVEAKPDSVEAWVEFGKFERLQRKFAKACECFETAHAFAPDDHEILAQLATTYVHVDKTKSSAYFREFIKREQDVDRILRVSKSMRAFGLAELSLEGFSLVTELQPKNDSGYSQLGETHMQLKQYRLAARSYAQALELDPSDLVCVYNVGAALSRAGDPRGAEYFAKAIDLWEKFDHSGESADLIANFCEAMSQAYLALGKIEHARELLEKALVIAKDIKRGTVFSSTKYVYQPVEKFVIDLTTRLEELKRRGASNSDG